MFNLDRIISFPRVARTGRSRARHVLEHAEGGELPRQARRIEPRRTILTSNARIGLVRPSMSTTQHSEDVADCALRQSILRAPTGLAHPSVTFLSRRVSFK